MQKTFEINKKSKIKNRYSVLSWDEVTWHQQETPTMKDADKLFKRYGIPLAVQAATKALEDWGGAFVDITHLIVVTCTNTSNPGIDFYIARDLGLRQGLNKTLLHGVGCAGGVAALRAAQGLLLGEACRNIHARALVVACELSTIFARSELESVAAEQHVSSALALFADCSSAMVLSNGISQRKNESQPIWDILNCRSTLIDKSEGCIEFNVGPLGKLELTYPGNAIVNIDRKK
jgi:type III polyketide synthase